MLLSSCGTEDEEGQTGTPSCAPQLLQPGPAQQHRLAESFPPNSKAVPELCASQDELCWLQKIWIFPDSLTNNAFPGNHQAHVSGGVCRGWDTAQGTTCAPFPLGLGQEAAGLQLGWGGAGGQSWFLPLHPWPSQPILSPSPPRWLPNNSRTNPSAPGSHLAPLC